MFNYREWKEWNDEMIVEDLKEDKKWFDVKGKSGKEMLDIITKNKFKGENNE